MLIDTLYAEARDAWPVVDLPLAAYVEGLARHAVPYLAPAAALAALVASDLYLATACSIGDPRALAAFEVFTPDIEGALHRLRLEAAEIADLLQVLREKLFVGRPGVPPKIAAYAGRGSLRSWVKSAATRHGLNLLQARRAETPLTDDVLLGLRSTGDPLLDLLKQKYRGHFKDAFHAALRGLAPRERALLGQYFVDELTIDELAAIYGVHRATAARWVAKAREEAFVATTANLRKTLDVDRTELDSILRLIDSQLEASMSKLLTDG